MDAGLAKISKVLIANRGEIARRIIRACDKLKLGSVAICSDVDREALFAREAREAIALGGNTPAESYLAVDKIIAAAKRSNSDAVHPGYGFLSENADFAQAVVDAGLIFIGPTPDAIRTMGNKSAARRAVSSAGVPVVPGTEGGLSDAAIVKAAAKLEYPLLIKATAGGGGRGMRVARSEKELRTEIPRARSEAKKYFASDDVFVERLIENPRHIEVQVFGDSKGNIVHFGTRDCSIQRRHQKLVEEAPAPLLSPATREALHNAAVLAAKSVRYENAGTVEFLVLGDELFFLEMNTRIQVEHPVTEEVTGIDLVELQIKIARGEKLPLTQKEIKLSGHAIEFRINAEDVGAGFRPTLGKISAISRVEKPWLRYEEGYEAGDEIHPFYDGLVSKVIVKGADRSEALLRAREIFREFEVAGISTTIPFFRWLLHQDNFRAGGPAITYIENHFRSELLVAGDAAYRRDSNHQGVGHQESVRLESGQILRIIHLEDGLFLGVPEVKATSSADCRLSNSRKEIIDFFARPSEVET